MIQVGEVMQRQLLANRVGTLPDYPARSLPRYSTRKLAPTQLLPSTVLLTPNFLSSMLAFLYHRYSTIEKEEEKTLFIRLSFNLRRFLCHWWDSVALGG